MALVMAPEAGRTLGQLSLPGSCFLNPILFLLVAWLALLGSPISQPLTIRFLLLWI